MMPVRVVGMMPDRVVGMMPDRVVGMIPDFVVGIIPDLPSVVPETAKVNIIVQAIDVTFFIVLLLVT